MLPTRPTEFATTLPLDCTSLSAYTNQPDVILDQLHANIDCLHRHPLTACIQDILTSVYTTAAAPNATANDEDDNSALTLTSKQQWDAFYEDFLHFVQSIGTSNPSTNKDKNACMTALYNNADSNPPVSYKAFTQIVPLPSGISHLATDNQGAPTTAPMVNEDHDSDNYDNHH